VALLLKRRGIERVRPLAGGFEAWILAGHPVEPLDGITETSAEDTAVPSR
jgi:3-mercaptopyruvate sulfurtransferase SseA